MNAIVIASGESLTQEQCDAVRGFGITIAVSDAYKMAPWCSGIVSCDRAWWKHRTEAFAMDCAKFCQHPVDGLEYVAANEYVGYGSSSGALGLWIAAKRFAARRILMLGFDNKGTHFFGAHEKPLKNPSEQRFKEFALQYFHIAGKLRIDGIDVRNCTPGTALDVFPKATLEEGLTWLSKSALAA